MQKAASMTRKTKTERMKKVHGDDNKMVEKRARELTSQLYLLHQALESDSEAPRTG